MADSCHIIDGQVVPFHGGRKDTNTGAWRDATPMELQLQAELCAAERALEETAAALESAWEDAERYRWLRGSHWYVGPEPDGDTEGVSLCDRNDGTLDAAIDQARRKEARNG